MKTPGVSVVIPNYNYARYLPECIESVIGQTYRDWEIIVVDDNSTDGSCEVVEHYVAGNPERIRVIKLNDGPSGTPRAINAGVRAMRGRYFSWLSSDDRSAPTKLERLVDLGLLGSLDGLSIHAYVYGTKPEAEFFDRVKELKTYLSSIGKAEFPVYITEFGWTTAKGTWQEPIDELTQAKYLSRAFLLLATEDIKAAVYFCQLYRNAPNPGEEAFSILHQDHTPKPAFAAFANASRWLAGISQERRLVQNGDLNLALFLKGQTAAVAAWDTGGGSFLSFESEPLAAEDMTGRPGSAEPRAI